MSQNYYKVTTSFEQNLGVPIRKSLVTSGRFLVSGGEKKDEAAAALAAVQAPLPSLCLACASNGQSVIIHKGGNSDGSNKATHTLNFGKETTALTAAPLNTDNKVLNRRCQDALIVGSANSVLAYDVDNNKQYYYKDVEDGVRAVVCGEVPLADGASKELLTLVGGNCSVYGFDKLGAERYWTVTGDMVTSMMCLPWGKDISTALVVSSEDNELRVFRGEEVLTTFTEVDRVSQLIPSALRPALNSDGTTRPRGDMDGKFAYLLDNGTVGVYRKSERLWRVKGKSVPVSAAFCDLDCDGVEELVVGWQNGRVEVRSDLRPDGSNKGGEVLFRVDYNTPVAAVINEDYRDEGKELPIICSVDGTVRGVTLLESNLEDAEETRMLQQIEELEKERQMLTAQLSDLEGQLELKRKGESDALMPEAGVGVHVHVYSDLNIKKLVIAFSLVNGQPDTIIHSCALRCESSIFGDDTNDMCYINDISSKELHCVVAYPDDVSSVVHASIAVGTEHAESFQIHEMAVQIPKYVMYALPSAVQGKYTTPSGHVMLKYPKKLQLHTIDSNLREMFFLPPDLQLANTAGNELVLELLHIRDGSPLSITIRDTASGKGEIFIQAEKISTAGDVVTSLSSIPGGLCQEDAPPDEVSCDFPEELSQLRTLIQHVDESNEVRAKLSAGMADSAASVKTLLLCAENARLLGDLTTMRKVYSTLYEGNRELMGENAKRVVNFEELKGVLKELNTFIQWAAKLRVGNAKTELVAACRNALKDNRTTALIDLIRDGKE